MTMIDDKRANPAKQPTAYPDEVAIAQIEPHRPGAGMLHTGDQARVLIARVKGQPGYDHGYDITLVRRERAFRVDHFENGEPCGTRWVPVASVHVYTVAGS